jgi:hypothetical protein
MQIKKSVEHWWNDSGRGNGVLREREREREREGEGEREKKREREGERNSPCATSFDKNPAQDVL